MCDRKISSSFGGVATVRLSIAGTEVLKYLNAIKPHHSYQGFFFCEQYNSLGIFIFSRIINHTVHYQTDDKDPEWLTQAKLFTFIYIFLQCFIHPPLLQVCTRYIKIRWSSPFVVFLLLPGVVPSCLQLGLSILGWEVPGDMEVEHGE